MGRFQKLISLFAFSVMILGLTIVASAQYRDRRGNNDYYGNYDISSAVRSLNQNARQFQKTLDRELDRSRLDGSRQEDFLNSLAKRLKNDAGRLDGAYDGYRDHQRSAPYARRVMSTGAQLDKALLSSRIGRNNYTIRNSWTSIERHLMVIARAYNINYNGRYGRNGNRGSNGRYGRNDRNRNDGRYGRNDNGRYGRNDNGRYGNTSGRYGNVESTISSLKYKARNLEDKLDQDRYDRNGSNLEGLSDRFKNAVDDLANDYRDRDGGYDEVQRVLSIGEQLGGEISQSRVGRGVRNDWKSINRDLKTLAKAYNVRYRGNNRSGSRIRDIFRNFPF